MISRMNQNTNTLKKITTDIQLSYTRTLIKRMTIYCKVLLNINCPLAFSWCSSSKDRHGVDTIIRRSYSISTKTLCVLDVNGLRISLQFKIMNILLLNYASFFFFFLPQFNLNINKFLGVVVH